MTTRADSAQSPSPVEQEKKRGDTSGKKATSRDDALERVLVVVRLGDKRQLFDLTLARRREVERRLWTMGAFAME